MSIVTINNNIKDYLVKNNLNILTLKKYNLLKSEIFDKFDFNNIEDNQKYDIIDNIFNTLFTIRYKFNNIDIIDKNYDDNIIVPDEYKYLESHFNKLKNTPQPVQRTKEWYDYRHDRITASDTAAAIDMNPYEPVEAFILKKCDPTIIFKDNDTVFFGRKYEAVASLLYEHIYNVKVVEFGALPSEKYPFLGASPDGICSKYTLDNKFSLKLGTMLEIKCPVTREIQITGNIIGDICPHYYYCQIQQQLECCELNICDFWQCKIIEYKTKNEYIKDTCKDCIISHTILDDDNNPKLEHINISKNLKKGIILEFYPKNFKEEFIGDKIVWKSKYVIPPSADIDELQYNDFILNILDKYKDEDPELYNNYYFNKIIYWKLVQIHNAPIIKDAKFILNILPILKLTWDKVIYYRNNLSELDKLKKIITKRKKYVKQNTKYVIYNEFIIDNNILFLNDKINIPKILCDYNNKDNIIPDDVNFI